MKNIITKIIIVFIIFFIGFYLYKNNLPKYTPLPQQYLEDRETFGRVNQLFNDAMGMTQAPDNSGKPFDIPKDQETQIISKLEDGINLSKQIDDGFLDYLNPDLKNNFKNKYIKGNQLFYEGLRGDTSNENSTGVKNQIEGNRLIGEWLKWWNINKNTIINKAFAK